MKSAVGGINAFFSQIIEVICMYLWNRLYKEKLKKGIKSFGKRSLEEITKNNTLKFLEKYFVQSSPKDYLSLQFIVE